MRKRMVSLLLCVVMLAGLLPTTAMAANDTTAYILDVALQEGYYSTKGDITRDDGTVIEGTDIDMESRSDTAPPEGRNNYLHYQDGVLTVFGKVYIFASHYDSMSAALCVTSGMLTVRGSGSLSLYGSGVPALRVSSSASIAFDLTPNGSDSQLIISSSGNTAVKKAGKRYVGGMLILSASTLLCKVIGLLFKIPMLRIIGIEGMAYFSSAYHIYMLLLTMSTAGLPVALSMMTAKSAARGDRSEVSRIWQVSLSLLLPLGVIGTAVLYFGAGYFAEWISIPGAEYAIKAISPTLFFICVSSAARGYFQGHEIMTPTALSQLIESLSKLLLGLVSTEGQGSHQQ